MENIDSLKPQDEVTVTILGPEGSQLFQTTQTGYHNLESAITGTIAAAGGTLNPEDCVFKVTNQNTGVTHEYRINAHGHLKLIV